MLGVCGRTLVSPGWLVLDVGVCTRDVQTLEIRYWMLVLRQLDRLADSNTYRHDEHRYFCAHDAASVKQCQL